MLADTKLVGELRQLQMATTSNHIKDSYRLAEANSYFNHGQAGISDTLGAALWSVDFMLTSASYGANGVNFHGGGPRQDLKHPEGFTYTPIDEASSQVTGVRPSSTGCCWCRSRAAATCRRPRRRPALWTSAFTIAQADGSINVVLLNKDATSGIQASVDVGAPVTSAATIYLQAGPLSATSGFTFGGAGVSATGAWNRKPAYAVPSSGTTVTVAVPPASAALVHVR